VRGGVTAVIAMASIAPKLALRLGVHPGFVARGPIQRVTREGPGGARTDQREDENGGNDAPQHDWEEGMNLWPILTQRAGGYRSVKG